jgi:hypothetical protein
MLTALLVLAGWVLFRSPDFTATAHMLAGLFGNALAWPTVAVKPLLARGARRLSALAFDTAARGGVAGCNRPVTGLALLLLACLLAVGQGQPTSFIYFQF